MKANTDKCHFLLSEAESYNILIDNYTIENSKQQNVFLDKNLCTKASQKLNALCRVSSYISIKQKRIIMKAFINSQFGYCPLIWMNHSKKLNQRINKIHERALRAVYNENFLSFEDLLCKENSTTIHVKNLQVLGPPSYRNK